MKVTKKLSAGLQCVQGKRRSDWRMAQSNFMDFLVLDELVSEEENETDAASGKSVNLSRMTTEATWGHPVIPIMTSNW